jgi:N4-gp56 family major capsid protein
MDMKNFIQKAYDANAFTTAQTTAGYVNPEIWEKELLVHTKANLVLANLAKNYDMRGGANGDTLNVTVGVEPSAASAVLESVSVTVQAYEKTTVIFSPGEKGTAYQMTNKERDRTFIPLMQDMIAQLGYALAKKVDTDCVTALQTATTNKFYANSKAQSSDVESSDTLDYSDVVVMKKAIMNQNLFPKYLVVNPTQYAHLLDEAQFKEAYKFGDQVAKSGLIGTIAGVEVFVTTQIPIASSLSSAIMIGADSMGVPAFGIGIKRDPYIETEYHALERYTDIVAVMDYDVKLLREKGVALMYTWTD